jgi:hypothetical protein
MSKRFITAFASIAALIVIAAAGLRWYVRTHTMPAAHPCVNNLAVIDGCVQQWTLEKHKTTNDTPTWEDLRPWLTRGTNYQVPVCPQGGTYTLGRVGESPTCSIGERDPLYHSLPH